jgi:hypothetical protein
LGGLEFISAEFFDLLVIFVIVSGLFFAARRVIRDFRSGPRFPDEPTP